MTVVVYVIYFCFILNCLFHLYIFVGLSTDQVYLLYEYCNLNIGKLFHVANETVGNIIFPLHCPTAERCEPHVKENCQNFIAGIR